MRASTPATLGVITGVHSATKSTGWRCSWADNARAATVPLSGFRGGWIYSSPYRELLPRQSGVPSAGGPIRVVTESLHRDPACLGRPRSLGARRGMDVLATSPAVVMANIQPPPARFQRSRRGSTGGNPQPRRLLRSVALGSCRARTTGAPRRQVAGSARNKFWRFPDRSRSPYGRTRQKFLLGPGASLAGTGLRSLPVVGVSHANDAAASFVRNETSCIALRPAAGRRRPTSGSAARHHPTSP